MIIEEVGVKNFRSIIDGTLHCDCLTALVGRNGAGKSSFLKALEMFYDPTARVTTEDFYGEVTSKDIEISVVYRDLNADEKKLFEPYIDNEKLTVVRVFSLSPGNKSGTYHGMRLQQPDFNEIRNAGGKRDITSKYNEFRAKLQYSSLPKVSKSEEALDALAEWEKDHPDECSRMRDDGQFFGFTGVGQGYLGRHTRFIRIPAVRDASDDATEKRGSCVTEIMDLVVRSVLATRKDVTNFKDETQQKYKDIFDPSKLTELTTLQSRLTETLQYYAPDSGVLLKWAGLAEISIPMPQAEVRLLEDGYESAVQHTGHGLQRAFILTMLQHLIAAREIEKATKEVTDSDSKEVRESAQPEDIPLPTLMLAIEEPELYQHPSRQRHMASILFQIAKGAIPGVAKNTQVMYSTHSPLFVGIDRFDQIRLLRKDKGEEGKPKITKVAKADLTVVAEELWDVRGREGAQFTAETLRPRLVAVMTPYVNEGFFSETAVLVEGEGDRAAMLGVARFMNHDFDSAGISVIPCLGKNNLDRPFLIFRSLGIPTYILWDSDCGGDDPRPETNRCLLRLVGQPEEDWPDLVESHFACFRTKLETVLSTEIGSDIFNEKLSEAKAQFGISNKRDALKNPSVLQYIVENAAIQGRESQTMKNIVAKIIALKTQERESNDVVGEIAQIRVKAE